MILFWTWYVTNLLTRGAPCLLDFWSPPQTEHARETVVLRSSLSTWISPHFDFFVPVAEVQILALSQFWVFAFVFVFYIIGALSYLLRARIYDTLQKQHKVLSQSDSRLSRSLTGITVYTLYGGRFCFYSHRGMVKVSVLVPITTDPNSRGSTVHASGPRSVQCELGRSKLPICHQVAGEGSWWSAQWQDLCL